MDQQIAGLGSPVAEKGGKRRKKRVLKNKVDRKGKEKK